MSTEFTSQNTEKAIDLGGYHLSEATLASEFHFDLNGSRPTNELLGRNKVLADMAPVDSDLETLGVPIREIFVVDPYVNADRAELTRVHEYVSHLEEIVLMDGLVDSANVGANRTEARHPHHYNRYTRAWLAGGDEVQSRAHWRSLVPTAHALSYLASPIIGRPISDIRGRDEIGLSAESASLLRFVVDGIAIRDRGAAMRHLAMDHLLSRERPGRKARWLSLASGSAESVIQAAIELKKQGIDVDLTLVDVDQKALEAAKIIAKDKGFEGHIETHQQNVIDPHLKEKLTQKSKNKKQEYDIVESMGFFEYLPQTGDEIPSKYAEVAKVQASDFMRMSYTDFVAADGCMMVGNMMHLRPQLIHVLYVVDWWGINLRSEETLVRITEEAKVSESGQVSLHRVHNADIEAHVYDIVKITKAA